ncbi:response regulator [Ningiella sp. W23]|uniref:response regulator n=1 Tax=Ningiella sp. W23 TaxID=3023715 RepID=UPI0037584CD6
MSQANNNVCSILVVDDGDIELKLMGHYLSRVECSALNSAKLNIAELRIFMAKSISQALDIARKQSISICLCDYYLDNELGTDLYKLMLKEGLDMPLVMVTGLEQHDIDELLISQNIQYVLPKEDLSVQSITQCIRQVLSKSTAS